MSDDEIIAAIRNENYPDDLTDDNIKEAIQRTLRRVKFDYPIVGMGFFTTVQSQQVYDLFNPVRNEATQQGVFPEGLWAYEVVWNSESTGASLDVFGLAPLLQGLALTPGTIYRNTFFTPGDWVMWDLNWAAFMHRFAPMSFEHVENRYGAPIRIYPKPTCVTPVLVKFSRYRTAAQIQQEDEEWFLLFVEAFCSRALANTFSLSAGTKVGEVQDAAATVKFWQQQASDRMSEALSALDSHRRVDVVPGIRSNQP